MTFPPLLNVDIPLQRTEHTSNGDPVINEPFILNI